MAVNYLRNHRPRSKPWTACWFIWVGPVPRVRKRIHIGYYATEGAARTAEAEWKQAHGR